MKSRKEFVLVLDDYHLIQNIQINELINQLLRFPPQLMHLVIICRSDPFLNLSSLRVHSRINEIRMAELCFNESEILELLKNIFQTESSIAISHKLMQQTEGWITGLRLLLLMVKKGEDLNESLEKIHAINPTTTNFLLEEVISNQPEPIRNCILKMSILDRFCDELVNELCFPPIENLEADITGEAVIQTLINANLFTISLDYERKWYRFHHLFREMLQNQLKKQHSVDEINVYHLKASEWFDKNELSNEAFNHLILSQDYVMAAKMAQKYAPIYESQKKWHVIQKMLDRLPESIIQEQAELLLLQAQNHFYHLNMGLIPPLLDRIDSIEKAGTDVQKLYGKVSLFKGFIAFYSGDGITSLANFNYAFEHLPADDIGLLATAELYIALSNQMTGNYRISIEHSTKRLKKSATLHLVEEIYINWALIQPQIIHGDLVSASRYLIRQHSISKLTKMDYVISWCHYLDGYIHLLNGKIDEAIQLIKVANEKKYLSYPRSAIDAMALVIYAYQAKGQSDKAKESLKTLNEFVAYLGPYYQPIADSVNSHLAIMQDNRDDSIKWLKTNEKPDGEVMIFWYEIPCIGWCRALIAEGSETNLKEAQLQLQVYAKQNEEQYNSFQQIGIKVLQALAYEKQNEIENALSKMKEAVLLAIPGDIELPFLDNGPSVLFLLQKLHSNGVEVCFLEKIFAVQAEQNQSNIEIVQEKVVVPKSDEVLLNSLTVREAEVTTLLAQGLRNKEIADKLYVSTGAIKKHLYNTFQKLHVSNRLELVNKAKELGLLEVN